MTSSIGFYFHYDINIIRVIGDCINCNRIKTTPPDSLLRDD